MARREEEHTRRGLLPTSNEASEPFRENLRAVPLPVAGVGSAVAAHCGDAPASPYPKTPRRRTPLSFRTGSERRIPGFRGFHGVDGGRVRNTLPAAMKSLLSLIAALALLPLLATADDAFPSITTADLKAAIAAKQVTLLDVNGSESYAEDTFNALDFEVVEKDLVKALPADKSALVVAYCGNERCTAYKAGAEAAKKLRYTNVKHYSKGIAGWKKEGQATAKAN